jgi:hypothetical protein
MKGGRSRIRCGATGGITPCDEQSPALKGRSVVGSCCSNLPQRSAVGIGFCAGPAKNYRGHNLAAVRHAAVASDGLAGYEVGGGR